MNTAMKKTYIKPAMQYFDGPQSPQFLIVTSVTGENFRWNPNLSDDEEDR